MTPGPVPPLHKSNESRHERRYPIVVPSFDNADFTIHDNQTTIIVHESKSIKQQQMEAAGLDSTAEAEEHGGESID